MTETQEKSKTSIFEPLSCLGCFGCLGIILLAVVAVLVGIGAAGYFQLGRYQPANEWQCEELTEASEEYIAEALWGSLKETLPEWLVILAESLGVEETMYKAAELGIEAAVAAAAKLSGMEGDFEGQCPCIYSAQDVECILEADDLSQGYDDCYYENSTAHVTFFIRGFLNEASGARTCPDPDDTIWFRTSPLEE